MSTSAADSLRCTTQLGQVKMYMDPRSRGTCSGRKLPSPAGTLSQHAVVYSICKNKELAVRPGTWCRHLGRAVLACQTAVHSHTCTHRVTKLGHDGAVRLTADLAGLQRQLHACNIWRSWRCHRVSSLDRKARLQTT